MQDNKKSKRKKIEFLMSNPSARVVIVPVNDYITRILADFAVFFSFALDEIYKREFILTAEDNKFKDDMFKKLKENLKNTDEIALEIEEHFKHIGVIYRRNRFFKEENIKNTGAKDSIGG